MALGGSSDPHNTNSQGGNGSHSDWIGPSNRMALRHQYGGLDPDMALGYTSDLDVTMALGASVRCSDECALATAWPSHINMASNDGPDHRHLWPSLVTWVTDINPHPSCGRAMDPDMALGGSTGPDMM